MRKGRASKLLLVILMAFAALFSGYYVGYFQKQSFSNAEIEFSKKWNTVINNENYGELDLDKDRFPLMKKGDVIGFESEIPTEIPLHPIFIFRTVHSDIEVFVDGQSRYSYGQDQLAADKMVGYGYHYISLTSDDAGKDIRVVVHVSENDAFTSLDMPIIVDADYYQRDFMIQGRIKMIIMQFLVLFGIAFVIIAICTWRKNVDSKRLFSIAMFSLSIGLWSLCSTDLIRLYTYDLRVKNFIEFASLYCAPACIFAYFGQEIKKEGGVRKKIYLVVETALNIFFVVSILLHSLNIVHMPALLKLGHVLMVIAIICLIGFFIADVVMGNEYNTLLLYGFVVLTVFVVGDMIIYNVKKFTSIFGTDHYDSTIFLGMFTFVITLIADFSRRTFRNFYTSIKEDMLKRMAYTDEMTGLFNRHHMERVMDKIDEDKFQYAVIGFDLNGLKAINDSQGHDIGDEYITSFGKILLETFGDSATVVRTGGDEFEVIIGDVEKSSNTVGRLLNIMQTKIDSVNEKHSEWNMSVAFGMAQYNEPECINIRQAIKIADDRMYKMKKEMKSGC